MQTLTVHWPPAGAVAVDVAVLGVRAGGVSLATLLAAAVLVRLEEGDGAEGECVAEAGVRRGEQHLAGVAGGALARAAVAVRGEATPTSQRFLTWLSCVPRTLIKFTTKDDLLRRTIRAIKRPEWAWKVPPPVRYL